MRFAPYITAAFVCFMLGMGTATIISDRHYIPQLEQIKAQIDVANEAAKTAMQNGEIVYDKARKKINAGTAAVNEYRQCMLWSAQGEVGTKPFASCPERTDLSDTGSSETTDEIDFKSACFQLALWHESCSDYIRENKIPVR